MLNQCPAPQRLRAYASANAWLGYVCQDCEPTFGGRDAQHAAALEFWAERWAIIAWLREELFDRRSQAGAVVNEVVAVGGVAQHQRRLTVGELNQDGGIFLC
ncbi:MAG TPA: hypothetical protein VGJ60_11490 [Chloroflexota bacterium]